MNILVIGGMHGNEPLGLEVVKLFQKQPQRGIKAVFANKMAIKANSRFVKTDLNRSFPGDIVSADYESRRAAQLLELCRGYDLVLDFHNTHCPDNDCSFVGEKALPLLYKAASWLNLGRMIVADYDCINKYAPNCISVEISLDSEKNDAQLWYGLISELAKKTQLPAAKQIEKYKFRYRITTEDRDRFDLRNQDLKAFIAIKPELAAALGVDSPAYPIFIGDSYTPYNYGGLLSKINV